MNAQITYTEPMEISLQEHFVEQIEDMSLPAAQVLTDQQETRETDSNTPLFVP